MSDSPTLFADEQDLLDELRAMAPRPTAEFTTQLDARVAERFGEPERPVAAPRKRKRRFSLPLLTGSLASAAVAAVVVVVIVSGGGGSSTDSNTTAEVMSSQAAVPQRSATEGGGATSSAGAAADATAAAPSSPPAAAGSQERRVERQAQLTISVEHGKFDEAASRVPQIAAAANAIVDTSRVSIDSSGGEATYTLRVPVERLGDTMAQLSRLGRVTSSDATGNDITGAYVTADDRLGDLRAERDSVRRQLAAEQDPDQAEELSRRLNSLRDQVAQARAQVMQLQQRTSYSVVNLTLDERSKDGSTSSDDDDKGGIAGAIDDAGQILGGMAAVGIIVLAVAIPVLILLALLWKGGSVARRRRREAGLA